MDNLALMLAKQLELQEALGYDLDGLGKKERTAYIKEYTLHTIVELSEMVRELPYLKPWKLYDIAHYTDMYAATRAEFADVLHFVLNIALALNLTSEDIYNLYMNKNKENHLRQKDKDHYKRCQE